MIHPYNKHLLVKPDPEVEERTTKGGIIINDRYTKREEMTVHLRWGMVVACGAETEPIKNGMRVAYNPFDGFEADEFVLINMAGLRAYQQ